MSRLINSIAVAGLLSVVIGWGSIPYARNCAYQLRLDAVCKAAIHTWVFLDGERAKQQLLEDARAGAQHELVEYMTKHWSAQ
jgi:hypothetical protein